MMSVIIDLFKCIWEGRQVAVKNRPIIVVDDYSGNVTLSGLRVKYTLSNQSERLTIIKFENDEWTDAKGFMLPYLWEKGNQISIPLNEGWRIFPCNYVCKIHIENTLGQLYLATISNNKGHIKVSSIKQLRFCHLKERLKMYSIKRKPLYYLLLYVVLLCGAYLFCSDYIRQEIDRDRNRICGFYFSSKGYYASMQNETKIIRYEKTSFPYVDDESERQQMYGNYDNYFSVSKGWSVDAIKITDEGLYEVYKITPYAAVTDYSNPVNLIHQLRDYVKKYFDCSDYNASNIKDFGERDFKYHKLNSLDTNIASNNGSFHWWNISSSNNEYGYESGIAFIKYEAQAVYSVTTKDEEIEKFKKIVYVLGFTCCSIAIILLYILIGWLKKVLDKILLKFKSKNNRVPPRLDADKIDKLYQSLIAEIHPSNYMNPYDPDKVRIANDLLEVLQNNKGNRTMIEMIRDKAVKSLGISSLANDDNLLK